MKRTWVRGIILVVAARLRVRAQDGQVLTEDLSTYQGVTGKDQVFTFKQS